MINMETMEDIIRRQVRNEMFESNSQMREVTAQMIDDKIEDILQRLIKDYFQKVK